MSETDSAKCSLFKNIKYKISGVVSDEVIELLKDGGAEGFSYFSDYVTHCIVGDDPSESDISDANDLYEVPAVTSNWVILSAKCGKLLPIKGFSYGDNRLFSGVIACISQLSASDARAIWAMIKYHGGKCTLKLTSNVTHLIVGKPSGAKYDHVINSSKDGSNLQTYSVTPDWVVDSVRGESRCSEGPYHPRLLTEKQSSLSKLAGGLSTAHITGFVDDDVPSEENATAPNLSNELLEQLKQRMPWNQPASTASSTVTSNTQPSSPNAKLLQSRPVSAILPVTPNQVPGARPKLLQPPQPQQQAPLQQQLPQQQVQAQPQPLPQPDQLQKQLQQTVQQQQVQQQPQPQPQPQTQPLPQQSVQQLPQQQRVLVPQQLLQQAVPNQWRPPHTVAPQFQQAQPQQQQIQIQHQLLQHQQVQQQVQQQAQQPQQQQQQQQLLLSQQVKTHPQQFIVREGQTQQQYVNTTGVTTTGQLTWQQQQTQPQSQPQAQQYQQIRQPQQPQSQAQQQAGQAQQAQQLTNQQIQQRITWTQSGGGAGAGGGGGPPRQLIHMDAQTHAQLQQMDPQQRALFLQGLQKQRQLVLQRQLQAQQQQQQQQRQTTQVAQTGPAAGASSMVVGVRQSQVTAVIRGHLPAGLTPQQQLQWVQHRHHQQILIHQNSQLRQQVLLQQQQQQPQGQTQSSQPQSQTQPQPPQQPQQQTLRQQTVGAIPGQSPVMQLSQQQHAVVSNAGMHQQAVVIQQAAGPNAVSWQNSQLPASQIAQLKLRQQHLQLQRLQQLKQQAQQQQQVQQQQVQQQQSQAPSTPGLLYNGQDAVHSNCPTPAPQVPTVAPIQAAAINQHPVVNTVPNADEQENSFSGIVQDVFPAVQGTQQQQALVVNAKTKTALANMLSIRLQGGHSAVNSQLEGSASGQLRLMTAQHHAQQHQPPAPAPPPPNPTVVTPQQPQAPSSINTPHRTTLGNVGNVPNSHSGHIPSGGPGSGVSGTKSPYTQTAARVAAVLAKSAAATPAPGPAQPRAHFYGHNPNLKLPPDMFLLGCIFLIVEYDRNGFDVHQWQRVVTENGGDVEASYSLRVTHILCQTQKHPLVQQGLRDGKRCITADWLSDITLKQQVLPPWLALHFPTPFSDEKPCRNLIISYSGFEGEERIRVKKMIETVGAKTTSYYSSHNHILVCRRPDGDKYRKAREWGKSVVNVQWLNEILFGHYSCLQQADSHKYQQFNLGNPFRIDYALVPHLMAAWKMPINVMQESYDRVKSSPPLTHRRKRPRLSNSSLVTPDPDQENRELALDIPVTNPNPPPVNKRPFVVFSGVENTVEEQRKVWQLGGVVAKSCREATHLLMNKPQRTFKLLCCLSTCKYILSLNWLLDSHEQNTLLDEEPYSITDSEFERNHDFSILNVLKNPDRKELFKGKTFYLTPGVVPSPSALREIIECAGGTVDKQRKSLKHIQEAEPHTYLIVTVTNDLHLVADVLRANIGVYNTEFVMSAVMKQKIDYDSAVKRNQFTKKT